MTWLKEISGAAKPKKTKEKQTKGRSSAFDKEIAYCP